jgi:DNA gyrase subunit A
MNLGEGDTLLAIARNAEASVDEEIEEIDGAEESESE